LNIESEQIIPQQLVYYGGVKLVKKDYFFILGGGKTLIKEIDIDYMKNKLFNDDDAIQISTLNNKNKYLSYLTVTPCLCKSMWFKNIFLEYGVPYVEIEYQLRELALLTNKKCLSYKNNKNSHEYYPKYIKSYKYKDEWNVIYSNISTDEEIEKLILDNGEWHKNIINSKLLENYNKNDNIYKNFYLKTIDKDWIYRFTGYYGFVPKKKEKYYKRYIYKGNKYLCNKNSK